MGGRVRVRMRDLTTRRRRRRTSLLCLLSLVIDQVDGPEKVRPLFRRLPDLVSQPDTDEFERVGEEDRDHPGYRTGGEQSVTRLVFLCRHEQLDTGGFFQRVGQEGPRDV